MITEVNAVNFRQNLGEMLNQVQYRKASIVVNKDGKPVAALVGADLFARIRTMRDRFDQLSSRVAEDYEGVSADQGMAEIDAATARERRRDSKIGDGLPKVNTAESTRPSGSGDPERIQSGTVSPILL